MLGDEAYLVEVRVQLRLDLAEQRTENGNVLVDDFHIEAEQAVQEFVFHEVAHTHELQIILNIYSPPLLFSLF